MRRKFLLSLGKILFIIVIFVFPLVIGYIMDGDKKLSGFYLYENILNISLMILFLGLFNFLFDEREIRYDSIGYTLFSLVLNLLVVFILVVRTIIYFLNQERLNIDNVNLIVLAIFALTIVFYLVTNQWITNQKVKYGGANIVKYVINVSIPEKIKKLYSQSSNLKKSIFWIILRFIVYLIIAVTLTQIITWVYIYELTIPNILTVFSSVWAVITLFLEIIYQRILVEYKAIN